MRSKALFGNSYRLEVFEAAAQLAEPFSPRDVARRVGVADNLVATQLRQLCAAGLLVPHRAARGSRYERQPSVLWQLAPSLVDELSRRSDLAPGSPRDPLRAALDVAQAAIPDVDAHAALSLVRASAEFVLRGELRTGLDPNALLVRAGLSRRRLSKGFGRDWQLFANVALRTTLAHAGAQFLYEEISSMPVPVRREANVLGTDRWPGHRNSLRLLTTSIATSERHFPVAAMPFTIGTRDDAASERFDPERSARFSAELGAPPPVGLCDHVANALMLAARARDALAEVQNRQPDLVPGVVRHGFATAFSSPLVIGSLPFGPPTDRASSAAGVMLPGADPDIVAAVEAARRPALLLCSRDADTAECRGIETGLSGARQVAFRHNASYHWSAECRQLLRIDLCGLQRWRVVGFSEGDLTHAVHVLEHHLQTDSRRSLSRWSEDLGLIRVRHSGRRQDLQALITLTNVALAVSEREREPDAATQPMVVPEVI